MEERKQELVIKISNQAIEIHLEKGSSENLHTFCHVDDNTLINMKDTDDFIKFLAIGVSEHIPLKECSRSVVSGW